MPRFYGHSKRSIWKGRKPKDFECPLCNKSVSILVPQPKLNESDEPKFCCKKCKEKLKGGGK